MTKRKRKVDSPLAGKSIADLQIIKGGALAEMIGRIDAINSEPDLQDADADDNIGETVGMLRQHGYDLDEAGWTWEEADRALRQLRKKA
jgi:hypothetical protein